MNDVRAKQILDGLKFMMMATKDITFEEGFINLHEMSTDCAEAIEHLRYKLDKISEACQDFHTIYSIEDRETRLLRVLTQVENALEDYEPEDHTEKEQ